MDRAPSRLADAKDQARALIRAGDYHRALAITHHLLAAFPLDDELRVHVAEILVRAGLGEEAAELWGALARHWIETGQPLRAIVAAHVLAQSGRPRPDILPVVARTYAQDSPRLAPFATRRAPPDQQAHVPVMSDDIPPFDELSLRAHAQALDLSPHGPYQVQLHRIPLLSDLGEEALRAVLGSMRVHRLGPGAVVLRQGETGSSVYLVAAGELRVFVRSGTGEERELARVHENCLVGEMALLTRQARIATVTAVREADVIELTRDALDAVADQIPALKVSLDRFARERLIKNLLHTSPLFTPFTKDQQAELLRRFEGVEVDPGIAIIDQGEPGRGLFVILSGELEVLARDPVADGAGGAAVHLAQLRPGDIFGEMSLLTNQPTSATVRSVTRCNLLYLARVYVERLSAAFPEVRAYFAEVAERRVRDNNLRLGAALPEEPVDLDISDSLFL